MHFNDSLNAISANLTHMADATHMQMVISDQIMHRQ